DALPLKNPFPLLKSPKVLSSDVVGAFAANKPSYVREDWRLNSTFNMGFMLFRYTLITGMFWEELDAFLFDTKLNKTHAIIYSDQGIINSLLHTMSLTLRKTALQFCLTLPKQCFNGIYQGTGSSDLKVTAFPEQITCRRTCKTRTNLHNVTIWHPQSKGTEKNIVWFLRPDWQFKVKNSNATGIDFLKELTDFTKFDLRHF
ncbi:unnamed protein product, partial [Owenia fusiformis]